MLLIPEFWNAYCSIVLTLAGISTVSSAPQFLNIFCPSFWRFADRVTLESFVQSMNNPVVPSSVVTLSGITKLSSALQYLKTALPIFVSLLFSSNVTDVSAEQPSKKKLGMVVIRAGKRMLSSALHPNIVAL